MSPLTASILSKVSTVVMWGLRKEVFLGSWGLWGHDPTGNWCAISHAQEKRPRSSTNE